jgi:hypothetical protein
VVVFAVVVFMRAAASRPQEDEICKDAPGAHMARRVRFTRSDQGS